MDNINFDSLSKKHDLENLDIDSIKLNPFQPRESFDQNSINSLAQTIKQHGILQPLVVSRKNGGSVLIAGERRLRAARLAGLTEVPVIFKDLKKDEDLVFLALIENLQRDNLNPMEEAKAYKNLIDKYGFTHQKCGDYVGKDRVTISNIIRLLSLPVQVQDMIASGKILVSQAKILLSLNDQRDILKAAELVVKNKLNVKETERLCQDLKKSIKKDKNKKEVELLDNINFEYISETLRSSLRTKVALKGSPENGKIEISFFSQAELDRIVSLIGNIDYE